MWQQIMWAYNVKALKEEFIRCRTMKALSRKEYPRNPRILKIKADLRASRYEVQNTLTCLYVTAVLYHPSHRHPSLSTCRYVTHFD